MTPAELLEATHQFVGFRKYPIDTELALQDAIEKELWQMVGLGRTGLLNTKLSREEQFIADPQREVVLTARDRPDFMVGPLAIELKVKGSPADVARQLMRYAEHPSVGAILLVTTRSSHRAMPAQMCGKPVRVLYLMGSCL